MLSVLNVLLALFLVVSVTEATGNAHCVQAPSLEHFLPSMEKGTKASSFFVEKLALKNCWRRFVRTDFGLHFLRDKGREGITPVVTPAGSDCQMKLRLNKMRLFNYS